MPFKPERGKRKIKFASNKKAREAGKVVIEQFAKTFKKLAESEHAEKKCANCIYFTDKITRDLKSKMLKQDHDAKFACTINTMKTEPPFALRRG
jgi:hypothetical protein